jgi:hypothetical protein
VSLDLNTLVAIDVHAHAEEPCGTHADDGYDDFQAAMAAYFKSRIRTRRLCRRPPPITASGGSPA